MSFFQICWKLLYIVSLSKFVSRQLYINLSTCVVRLLYVHFLNFICWLQNIHHSKFVSGCYSYVVHISNFVLNLQYVHFLNLIFWMLYIHHSKIVSAFYMSSIFLILFLSCYMAMCPCLFVGVKNDIHFNISTPNQAPVLSLLQPGHVL